MTFSRRDICRLALASLPLSAALASDNDSRIDGVQLGVQTYSFRDLAIDQAIQAMITDKLFDCELFSPHIEAGGVDATRGMSHPAGGNRPSPSERAEMRKAHEEKLRQWRLTVPLDYFAKVRKKFDNAGINIYSYNLSLGETATDDEIDRSFDMAKALGVDIITTSTTLPMAARMAPFTDKHKMIVGFHGHSNVKDPKQFSTPDRFAKALAMSKYYRINLDIGHFTAAGFEPVEYINQMHNKIILLHLKDRKKNDGPNVVWGEGDTPIKQVLLELKEKKYPIPAFIEYEYKGTGSSTEEVAKCYAYCKQALNASA
ncbi:MAG TPA: sugar phosphate isomerase/epimerase [Bryobacteraceae bacterium]|jgi:sugar phosphate isomerase/epimerase|nr:sugar phosphate isomerase/epimerase [Bryobacteraceae bacterium]